MNNVNSERNESEVKEIVRYIVNQKRNKIDCICVAINEEILELFDIAKIVTRWEEETHGSLTLCKYVCGLPCVIDNSYTMPIVMNKPEYLAWVRKKYFLTT